MNQAKDIAAFVKKALTTFSISGNGYFYTIDSATGKRIPQELFFCDVVTDSVLDRLSVDLGISKQDILEMNEEPLKAYYAKYPFFRLYRNYISEWERQREFSDDLSAEEHLVAAIFGEKSQLKIEKRYDFDSVKKRLVKLLKEMDKLMRLILSHENILLAYRNIKTNGGSETVGTDRLTIKDIGKLSPDEVVSRVNFIVKGTKHGYRPKPVRRKDIPKPNGTTRPLGIPCIWDRLIQQCIKQIMEPICEAKFSENSYGFRPQRDVESAISATYNRLQLNHLHYQCSVVEVH